MRSFLFGLVVFMCCSGSVSAAIESYDFQNEEQRERYQQLSEELRCPKCQNQNLADSDSQIAADLRRELHQQLLAGKSDEAIVGFMRERYGDFVLYKPRVQRSTWLLWWGPIGLLLCVGLLLWRSRVVAQEPVRAPNQQSEESVGSVRLLQPDNALAEKELTPTKESSPVKKVVARWINMLSLLVLLAVAVGSLLVYQRIGALQAIEMTELGEVVFSGQLPQEQQQEQQGRLLVALDKWLALHPDDDRFIYMRARLLAESGMWDRAVTDYRRLVGLFPEQDNMLAEYAQVLFLQNNRTVTPDVLAHLKQALQMNPHNVTALGLLGMAAFEQKDYQSAMGFWQRLLRVVPQGTPQSEAIMAGVAKAQELMGTQVLPDTPAAGGADIHLRVQVTVAQAAEAKPDETVFVLLRAVNGPRMPLAAVKTTVAALAQPVLLDTANSPMRGSLDVSAIEAFEVVARLSRSGQPMAVAGDWEGVSAPLTRNGVPATLDMSITRPVVMP